jgi:hypothetical protein
MRQRGYNKMSLCYDFQKWTIISLAAFTISLSVGLVLQYAHGQDTEMKIPLDFGDGPQLVAIPNGCLGYSDQFLDGHAEVTVNKNCDMVWKQYANYFIEKGYTVTVESKDKVDMRGQPLNATDIK